MRKVPLVEGEFYHIYNRGVDKRIIFSDQDDVARFLQSMNEFNTLEPIGSIYENSFAKGQLGSETPKLEETKLVNFVAYCLNPNHFHFILEQVAENGISKFMQRLGGGYTNYFNEKEERSGALFQGVFKSIHINSNEYLLYLSAYVNLNDKAHQLGSETPKLVKSISSWNEYTDMETKNGFCTKDIILGQFSDRRKYEKFARSALESIIMKKAGLKDMEVYLIEPLGSETPK